ncbi:unannotated protein [freshwater metagenome]|uniref:Unannotated protein n=1 Tax=freshwater metagenome TaxID=449393 RepID=A0A6J7DUM1_9ZZZZ|nr:endolytic transglycosylase MltG [Actinomycetota bacterium]
MKHANPVPPPQMPDDPWLHDQWDDADSAPAAAVEKAPQRRRLLKWVVYVTAALTITAVLAGGAVGWWYIRQVNPSGEALTTSNFTVNDADTLDSVSARLQTEGIITNARVFRYYVRHKGGIDLKPGYYELIARSHMGNIMRVLNTPPEATYRKITFPEGFTLAQMGKRVERDLPPMTAAQFAAAAASPDLRSTLQPDGATSLEGLLFPDTYQVAGNESEAQVIARMIALMERVGRQENIATRAAELNLTPYQVLTVASMIEREAKFDTDRAKIARVIYNRIALGMPLQIDATLYYGQPAGTPFSVLRDLDTPYNTYIHTGLPPTPIAGAGRASIHAALHPEQNPSLGDPLCRGLSKGEACDYLYYVVADAEGHHVFAVTLDQHEANVQRARDEGLLK